MTEINETDRVKRKTRSVDVNGLGVPLPAEKTRFYRLDDDGQLEFTGENMIDHTPKNETLRVYLGNAFDLVGERKRTNFFKHITQDLIRESFEIEIRNRSEETVTVNVIEHLYRWSNWKINEHSHAYDKQDAQTIEFPVAVEPDGTQTVSYGGIYLVGVQDHLGLTSRPLLSGKEACELILAPQLKLSNTLTAAILHLLVESVEAVSRCSEITQHKSSDSQRPASPCAHLRR